MKTVRGLPCLVAVLAGRLSAATAEIRLGFDKAPTGEAPPGWTCTITGEGAAVWRIVADTTAPQPAASA